MPDSPVLLSVDGAVATITLNRPSAGNTIDIPLAQALFEAAQRCAADPAIRCVVLTGNGKLFCGGGDISGFASAIDNAPAYLGELVRILNQALIQLMRMPKPLLVLVNGPAAGAGFSLAIAGDIVISTRAAHFTAAHSLVGLTSDGGLSWLLPRLVGLRRATELTITNRRVGAEEAAAIGLVTRIVEDEAALAEEGARQAQELVNSAVGAIGGIRSLLIDSSSHSLESQLEREMHSIVAAGERAELREGVSAFLARRKPDFANAS